jgi:hypothetical protein
MRSTLRSGARSVSALSAMTVIALACVSGACGSGDEPYKPAPAWSGRSPNLPSPPQINQAPIKVGDAYTVAGASHHLRSRMHSSEVTKASIPIVGYIVEETYSNAPSCAIHKVGKKDPDDCPPAGSPPIEIPSFYIADTKGAGKDAPRIRVLGWAKNVATVYEAMEKYNKLKEIKDPAKDYFKDDIWSVDVPYPIPAVGEKVKVTGKYGFSFSKSSTGLVSDPVNGVMTYEKVEVLEPSPEKASFKNPASKAL